MPKSLDHKRRFHWGPYVALVPAALIAAFMYVGTMVWTIWISFTSSKMLPVNNFVGFYQYQRLFADERWQISATNLIVYVVLFIAGSLVLGLLLAIALDQRCAQRIRCAPYFCTPRACRSL
jgi:glucose/mannose transport system permease protein